MTKPNEPSKKQLLDWLDGHKPIGKQNPDHPCFDALRRLVEEQGEWGKKAGDILSDTPRLYLAVLDHEDIMDLLKEIRDFGKGGEDAR